jgi:hypothetical protein
VRANDSAPVTGYPVVICPERTDEDWPPENFLIKRSSAELRRLRIQSVNRAFALTLTIDLPHKFHFCISGFAYSF